VLTISNIAIVLFTLWTAFAPAFLVVCVDTHGQADVATRYHDVAVEGAAAPCGDHSEDPGSPENPEPCKDTTLALGQVKSLHDAAASVLVFNLIASESQTGDALAVAHRLYFSQFDSGYSPPSLPRTVVLLV
jgi:hypothetical protein